MPEPELTALVGLHNPAVRMSAQLTLQGAGYHVTAVESMEEFLPECETGEPRELYFLDTNLNLGGFPQGDARSIQQVRKALQSRGFLETTPEREASRLIGTTGAEDEAITARRVGFEVVIKPYSVSDLLGRYTLFCNPNVGKQLVVPPNRFDHLTSADLRMRLGELHTGDRRRDRNQLFALYQKAVKSWGDSRISESKGVSEAGAFFQLFDNHYRHTRQTWSGLKLPSKIPLVRTTDVVEGGLAHVVNGTEVYTDSRTTSMCKDRGTLAYLSDHELAHVLSRENPALMEALRKHLGYTGPHPVDFSHPVFDGRMLNNPDVTGHYATYIQIGSERLRVLPVVMLQEGYSSQSLAAAFNARELQDMFLVVEEQGETLKPVLTGGDPTFIAFGQANGFAERYGGIINPEYPVIHFDELWADTLAAVRRDLYDTERSEGIPRCDEGFLRGIDDLLRAA